MIVTAEIESHGYLFLCLNILGKGPKNKMEIFNEIFHEGGGSRVPLTFFKNVFLNHLESFPEFQNVFCI